MLYTPYMMEFGEYIIMYMIVASKLAAEVTP